MKIRPVVAELFHADGRTGMTTLTIAFRNSAKRLKTKVDNAKFLFDFSAQVFSDVFQSRINQCHPHPC